MKINVYSYKNVKKLIKEDNLPKNNWISLRDEGYDYLYKDLTNYAKNILIVYFDDVTVSNIRTDTIHPIYKKIAESRELILFNEEKADQIINFAKDVYERNEELNIHCWAGKSRSQAVGYVLNQHFNLFLEDNKEDFILNLRNTEDKFRGNFDVIRIMNKELYLK